MANIYSRFQTRSAQKNHNGSGIIVCRVTHPFPPPRTIYEILTNSSIQLFIIQFNLKKFLKVKFKVECLSYLDHQMDSKENGNFILKPCKRNETNPNILKFLFPVTYEKWKAKRTLTVIRSNG